MPEKIHYIPQFILREFKEDERSLLEWDKRTGGTALPRNIERAAQRPDFWPPDIEHGVMKVMDDRASKILQRKAYGKDVGGIIDLTPDERHSLAEWFGLWLIRVPKQYKRAKAFAEDRATNPQDTVEEFCQSGDRAFALFKERNPTIYSELIRQAGSEDVALDVFQTLWKQEIRGNPLSVLPDVQSSFWDLLKSQYYAIYALLFERLMWLWCHSGEEDFSIGDDPVCRLDQETGMFDAGLNTPRLQVTIPLSRKLTLVMVKRDEPEQPEYLKWIQALDAFLVNRFNRLQVLNAFQCIYGPSQVAVRPEDEAAEYGL